MTKTNYNETNKRINYQRHLWACFVWKHLLSVKIVKKQDKETK